MEYDIIEKAAGLEQPKIAFDNLIADAIQSMDAGGTLIIVRTERAGGKVAVSIAGSVISPPEAARTRSSL